LDTFTRAVTGNLGPEDFAFQAAAPGRAPLTVVGSWPVQSSDKVTVYTVRHYSNGQWACDAKCKGYQYRGRCRHIDQTRRENCA
jgi:hypothetical protein